MQLTHGKYRLDGQLPIIVHDLIDEEPEQLTSPIEVQRIQPLSKTRGQFLHLLEVR